MNHDLLHIQGKPYVLLPLHEYRMMSNSGTAGSTDDLPESILDAIAAKQQSAVKILRKFRGLTQEELAEAAELSRPYLTEIETGRKNGSVRVLSRIAEVLEVPAGLLL